LLKLLTQLQEHGLAFIKNIPTDEADDPAKLPQLETIIKAIGCVVRESFYGRTWDVKSVKNAKNIAYTSLDLGLHMDLLYFESPPGIQFLHSLKNTVTGGESIFLDSYHAALTLKRESPHHYKTLCETPITFHYDNDSHLMKQHRYTISENNLNSEAPFGLRVFYSPPFQGPLDKVTSVEQMENLVEAMRAFEDIMRRPGMVYRTRLEPGTAVVFRNLRVLHGRTEFDAQSGERHFKGSYVDYDVVSDRFLFLARKAGLM
ncbi:gamma-butyrobetaine dioxygenase, partial [Rhizoclosmatium globosum]